MRRSLVQGDDAARHPFLKQLPRHVRAGIGLDPVRKRNHIALRDFLNAGKYALCFNFRRIRRDGKVTMQDAKDFLLAYCACFVAVSAFIA
jgi:hypothetical protein